MQGGALHCLLQRAGPACACCQCAWRQWRCGSAHALLLLCAPLWLWLCCWQLCCALCAGRCSQRRRCQQCCRQRRQRSAAEPQCCSAGAGQRGGGSAGPGSGAVRERAACYCWGRQGQRSRGSGRLRGCCCPLPASQCWQQQHWQQFWRCRRLWRRLWQQHWLCHSHLCLCCLCCQCSSSVEARASCRPDELPSPAAQRSSSGSSAAARESRRAWRQQQLWQAGQAGRLQQPGLSAGAERPGAPD